MGRAVQLFREHAVPYTGFRAPYLHWNEDTMRVVEDYKFRYSSNRTVFWNVIDEDSLQARQREGLERGRAFYRPVSVDRMIVLPYRLRGFVEIPVSLPDDEILIDRMYINDADYLGEVWSRILEESYRRGELFTLQLHPERIDFFADALRGLLGVVRSKKPGIWVATLDQIAEWWVDKAANRIDLVRDGGKFRADIKACRPSGRRRPGNGPRLRRPATRVPGTAIAFRRLAAWESQRAGGDGRHRRLDHLGFCPPIKRRLDSGYGSHSDVDR
jgi:hypothetical protein